MGRALASLSLSWVVCACGSRACLHVGMSGSCMQFQRFSPVLPAAPSEYRSLSWNQLVAWQRDTAFWSSGAPASCCQRPWGARSYRCLLLWAPLASPPEEEDAGEGVCLPCKSFCSGTGCPGRGVPTHVVWGNF